MAALAAVTAAAEEAEDVMAMGIAGTRVPPPRALGAKETRVATPTASDDYVTNGPLTRPPGKMLSDLRPGFGWRLQTWP